MGQVIVLKVITITPAVGSSFALSSGTVGGWFLNNGTTDPTNNYFIHGLSNSSNQQGFALLQTTSGATNPNSAIAIAWNSAGTQEVLLNGTASLADNKWHHLCYVFDTANGGTNTLYVDGVGTSTTSSAAWNIFSGQTPQWDGSGPAGNWKSFQGVQLQGVADWFWSTAKLTALEVAGLAKGERVVGVRNVLGAWLLDNGADPQYDYSGHGWTLNTFGGNITTFGPPLTMFTPKWGRDVTPTFTPPPPPFTLMPQIVT